MTTNAKLAAIQAASNGSLRDMPNTDYNLSACDCAAEITGANVTACRMFNRKFREDAAAAMFGKVATNVW